MNGSPRTWEPMTLGLCCLLAFTAGLWMAFNGHGQFCVALCFSVASLVQVSDAKRQALIEDFRAALRDTDLGILKAAQHMGIDPSDLEKMLDGRQRFDVWRIEMLPDETRCCFYFRRTRRLGLPEFIRQAIPMLPAFRSERSA